MQRSVIVSCLLVVASGMVSADDLSGGPFDVAHDKLLRVNYRGRPLVAKDSLDYTSGFEQAEQLTMTRQDGMQILNVIRSHGQPVSYRKEIAVHPEGCELTVKCRLPAYSNDPAKSSVGYTLYVPLETLRGASWKAFTGRAHQTKVVEGRAGSPLSGIRYIAFQSERVRVVFDFNPQGVCVGGDSCSYGEPVGCWSMQRDGDFLAFSFGHRATFCGGVFMGKCLIYEGGYDYEARHPWRVWGYRGKTPPPKVFAFGTAQPTKEAIGADLKRYSRELGFGWSQTAGLMLVQHRPTGLVNNAIRAHDGKAHEFLVDIVPGRWLVTLRVSPGKEPVGPMKVTLDGRPAAEDLKIPAGSIRTITAAVDHRDAGPLKIGFHGSPSWAVSSIALQPLLYASEDFSLDRGLWNVQGIFTP